MTSSSEMLDAGGGGVDIDASNININGGYDVLKGSNNVAIGFADTLSSLTTGMDNIAISDFALDKNTTGIRNIAIGKYALSKNISGGNNVAIGFGAVSLGTTMSYNVGVGYNALYNSNGGDNSALGRKALYYCTIGTGNTAIGDNCLALATNGWTLQTFSNCSGLGKDARVSASNQVQLGDSATTTYAYGSVQNRSDARDKADIIDADLGLDFILALSPKKWRWNYRESYHDQVEGEDGETVLETIENDGSRKRSRFHHGFIAQEVKAVMDALGVDFGGYQDHSMSDGGCDVLSLGYEEFIAPMVAAIQHQNSLIVDLTTRLEALEA